MGIFRKLFGGKVQQSGQSDPDSEVRRLADEASRLADEVINREYVGGSIMTNYAFTAGSETPLIKAVDKIIELAPEDPDFLFAKSEAHYMQADGETGQEYRKKTLAVAPNHFDANMRQEYHEGWANIFHYPCWSEQSKTVPAMMLALQSKGNVVQTVRDGLKLTIVILIPASQAEFPSNVIDSNWKPLWVQTPHGPVFEHYALLKLSTGFIRKHEYILAPYPVEPIHPRHGNWLIRRFCEVESIFIGFNDEANVIYNKRYVFPKPLRDMLKDVKSRLGELHLPQDYKRKYELAAQWYMQNSNLDDIVW